MNIPEFTAWETHFELANPIRDGQLDSLVKRDASNEKWESNAFGFSVSWSCHLTCSTLFWRSPVGFLWYLYNWIHLCCLLQKWHWTSSNLVQWCLLHYVDELGFIDISLGKKTKAQWHTVTSFESHNGQPPSSALKCIVVHLFASQNSQVNSEFECTEAMIWIDLETHFGLIPHVKAITKPFDWTGPSSRLGPTRISQLYVITAFAKCKQLNSATSWLKDLWSKGQRTLQWGINKGTSDIWFE